MDWTDGMDARLLSLVKDGSHSYREIGEIMSREFKQRISKGSAIGRARRLQEWAKPKPKPKEIKPVLLQDLERHHCRWPLGERAPYLYCAHPIEEGTSYCPAHCRASYSGAR